jgi:uncharacterized protein
MSFNIDDDTKRFRDIIRGKVKSDLKKFVASEKLLGQQGNKKISIPINSIDLPRFTYGKNSGGASQGSGSEGDPIDGQESEGDGSGKAGDKEGEHAFEADFTPAELASILGEELELPNLEDKGKDSIETASNRYTGISRQGPEGLRSVRRTYKQALKRNISGGEYDPSNPKIIPIKDDMRYRSPKMVEKPQANGAMIFVQDVSGSMGEHEKRMVRSMVFWIELWLKTAYPGLKSRYIVHDATAKEVSQSEFFTMSEGGGTMISSAYKLAVDMLLKDYPFAEWNSWVMHFSDSDNWSADDNALSVAIAKNGIMPNTNLFGYVQTTSQHGSGEFLAVLQNTFTTEDNIALARVDVDEDVLTAIKTFFGKSGS